MEYQLLTWEHLCGIRENVGTRKPCGGCADEAGRQVMVDDITNKSHKQLHKSIAQLNHMG